MDKTKIAIEIFNKCANNYQEKFMNVDLYRETFDIFCNCIKERNPDILELACGPGNITKYLLEQRSDFKISGIDLAPNMIELARINNPTAEFQLMDCRDIRLINKKFEAIMCGFCLPYFSKEDAERLIKDSSELLNSGGVLYISTMEDDYTKSGFKKGSTGDEMYMYYHEADHLIKALKENNFEVIDLQRKVSTTPDGLIVTDLIIISSKTEI